jgi:glycine oxidase
MDSRSYEKRVDIMKVAVIGNGILGLTSAREIAKIDPTCEIHIFGLARRSMAGSMAAAAMLNSFAELEKGYLEHKINQKRFLHSREATKIWPQYIEELQAESGQEIPHGQDTFLISNNSSEDIDYENFETICQALKEFDAPHNWIELRDIPGFRPSREGRSALAVHIQNEGWVDTGPTISALESILSKNSLVKFIDMEIVEVSQSQTRNELVLRDMDGSEHYYDKVLISAGAKSRNFFEQLGLTNENPKVLFGIGTTLRLRVNGLQQKSVVRTPNRGLACGLYSAPYLPDQLVIGATNQVTENERDLATVEDVRSLLSMAQRELNYTLSDACLLKVNTGYRPVSTDSVPLIGMVPLKNVYLCTGTRRDGWHLAPYLSPLIAQLVINDETPNELELYDPIRAPYRFITREKSIEMATKQYVSGMYQHGLEMPYGSYRNHISRNYEGYFHKLHDYAGLKEDGIPIDLIAYCSVKMSKGEEISI